MHHKYLFHNKLQPRWSLAHLLPVHSNMKRLTLAELRTILPSLDELDPLVDHLLAQSEPDPARTWSGSGALGTAGERLVRAEDLTDASAAIARRALDHRTEVYRLVSRAVQALADGDSRAAAAHLLQLANIEDDREDTRRAAAWADAAYRVARQEASDPRIRSLALRRRARYRRSEGRLREALSDYREAELAARAVDDVRGAAEAAIGAGNVLEQQGRWEEAEQQYRRALEILDELDDSDEPAPERWHALLNIHVALRSLGRLDDALECLARAEAVAAEYGDQATSRFAVENNKGQVCMVQGDFQTAVDHFRKAIEASTGTRAEVTIRLNLAEALLAMGRALDSAEEARQAELQAILAGLAHKLPEVYRLLGRIASVNGEPDAFVLFERALDIIDERGLPEIERAQTLQAYGEAEARSGAGEATGRQLLAEADRLYAQLGIRHRRAQWSDSFDAGPDTPDDRGTRDE